MMFALDRMSRAMFKTGYRPLGGGGSSSLKSRSHKVACPLASSRVGFFLEDAIIYTYSI